MGTPNPTHAPDGYHCPFCLLLAGTVNEHVRSSPDEIVYRNEDTAVFISTRWWAAAPGHAIVVPTMHVENIYSSPERANHALIDTVQRTAQAIRSSYPGCSGITIRQHNEPDGGQDVWHLHVHVFPRYPDDNFYNRQNDLVDSSHEDRAPYVKRLKEAMARA